MSGRVLACAALLVLAGCERVESGNAGNAVAVADVSPLPIAIDHATGCQYIGSLGHGVTPRLDSAGKPMCGGAK